MRTPIPGGSPLEGNTWSTSGDDLARSLTGAHASLPDSDDGYSNGLSRSHVDLLPGTRSQCVNIIMRRIC